jgi:hypothetical protein
MSDEGMGFTVFSEKLTGGRRWRSKLFDGIIPQLRLWMGKGSRQNRLIDLFCFAQD